MIDGASSRVREEECLRACNELLSLPLTVPEPEVLSRAVDLAVDVSRSEIGYLHYVNDDGDTIELGTWSTGTLQQCTATYDRHYPISAAGIWADTARTLRPHLHNDYAAVTGKRGLPEGHAVLLRHLGVPVVEDGVARLLLGLGNKIEPYDDVDVELARQLAETTWTVMARLREHRRLTHELELLQERQRVIRLSSWEWDPDPDVVTWDIHAARVLHLAGAAPAARGWQWFVDRLAPGSRQVFTRALSDAAERGDPLDVRVRFGGADGWTGLLRVQGHAVARTQGHGHLVLGTVLDVTAHEETARAQRRATHDALTGLYTRTWLLEELERRMAAGHGRASDAFGLLLVDLSDFRPVNEVHGPLAGDDVLRACADRLAVFSGGEDTVARLGGDTFALLRRGPIDTTVLRALADDVVGELSQPFDVGGASVRVGAAVGAVVSDRAEPGDVRGLLALAEQALFVAKRHDLPVVVAGEARP